MEYQMMKDAIIFAGLGAALWWLAMRDEPANPKGATRACNLRVKWHQARRREFMLRHGGLPVSMGRAGS